MKFTVAVVVLALAAFADASILGYPYGSALVSPYAVNGAYYGGYYAPALGPSLSTSRLVAPAAVAVQAAVHVPAPIPIAHAPLGGNYVAANRGSVHVAPLPGHIDSVASINQAPAPGTL